MNTTEQGVLQADRLLNLLIWILLLASISLPCLTYAEGPAKQLQSTLTLTNNTDKHSIAITYPLGNMLYADIAKEVSKTLSDKHFDISVLIPENKDKKTDLLIAIGMSSIEYINNQYPGINKLFISTGPTQNILEENTIDKNAILFMTQPYCKQLKFIKLLNENWNTISYLNNQNKPIEKAAMEQCAIEYNLKLHVVNTENTNHLTEKIKNALNHSDILLALPDKNIYNSRTVKNILLTSYRYRKPVIAFSRNFVHAGALAAIHSNTNQIAQSASTLVEQYFKSDQQFINLINYPLEFDISINSQVLRALDLTIPDKDQLKQALQHSISDKPGELQ